ncbi:MAG: hypothetical protein HZA28_04535, partial [Candidatus Omnitrophica bacterium]|nr:hypothetical protein [Candidatus Omnitrophota bacterium]
VGLVDLSTGVGTQLNPAPVTRPSDVKSTFTDGNGSVTTLGTDSFGAATATTDALGRVTTIARDADSNPTQITRPNGAVTTLTYDAKGNLLTTTDQSIGATTTFM